MKNFFKMLIEQYVRQSSHENKKEFLLSDTISALIVKPWSKADLDTFMICRIHL